MAERLQASLELHEAGEDFRSLRVLHSPHGAVRQVFDLMRIESESDWEIVAARLRAVPEALDGVRATLAAGLAQGLVSAQRQVAACAQQCDTWGGRSDPSASFFAGLVRRYPGGKSADDPSSDAAGTGGQRLPGARGMAAG